MDRVVRLRTFVALVVVAILSFALKFYSGPFRWWVNNWGPASVGYEMFFMLAAFLAWPRREAITPIAIGVCAATCLLEFLQLWHPPWLQAVRTTFLGKALLGTTFSRWDLPAYFVGCCCGWWLLRWILERSQPA